jgi:hypothetical protein
MGIPITILNLWAYINVEDKICLGAKEIVIAII